MSWHKSLTRDPVPALLASGNQAVAYFARRDLLGEDVPPLATVRELPEPRKILRQQRPDGSWGKPGGKAGVYPPNHGQLVATFKQFRILIEKYQFARDNPAIARAADFLFSFQTPEGDIRGFIGNQYATYYTGYVLSLLIKAGCGADPRVTAGLEWLLSMCQADGGWTIPILTHRFDRETGHNLTSQYAEPVAPDRAKPCSHNWTDMVLRAFAAHPDYRRRPAARAAGALLKASFFRADAYASYKSPRYWTRFRFWWPNLLTALESLALLDFSKDDPDIKKGLDWFSANQLPDGLWALETGREVKARDREEREWLGLRIGRMLKRYYGG